MVEESCKVESSVKTILTAWFSLIINGVNVPVFFKLNELKFKVHDDETIIFLSDKSSPDKSYESSPVIVITLSDTV